MSKDLEKQRIYTRKHYKANKEQYKLRNSRKKELISSYLKDYKSSVSCMVCGEDEPSCIDFHHLDPSIKDIAVSQLVGFGSLERLKKELEKCVPLCANCHRKVHAGKITI